MLEQLGESLIPGKVTILYGPRQVGKTTLLNDLLAKLPQKHTLINADEYPYREALASQSKSRLGELLGDNQVLAIDEAQRVPDIGLNLKILVDSFPQAIIIATGSASFDLARRVSEPLTGRTITFNLFPVSYHELKQAYGAFEARTQLERWLVWGGYPAIVSTDQPVLRARMLSELVGAVSLPGHSRDGWGSPFRKNCGFAPFAGLPDRA